MQPIPLGILKKKRPRHYQKLTFDLGTARTKELFWCVGDFIGVETITGSCEIRLNEVGRDAVNLQKARKIYTPFYRFYMTNSAQAGKTLTIYVGGEASFEIDIAGKMGIINVGGSDINPATEDTLALLNDIIVTPSDVLKISADTVRMPTDVEYTKYKEIKLNRRGKIRVKFDMKSSDGSTTVYARVYKNGVAVGTEQTTTSSTPVTKTEDIEGWSRNDLLQLYCHTDGAAQMQVVNFRLYWDEVGAEVVLD